MASSQTAYSLYSNSCSCGTKYKNNCAHYLSNALINGRFSGIDGGDGADLRKRNGMIVCPTGRPVRAKELRDWISRKYGGSRSYPQVGINFVYQERRSDGQGHVLLKDYTQSMVDNYNKNPRVHSPGINAQGTCDRDGESGWNQEFYYM